MATPNCHVTECHVTPRCPGDTSVMATPKRSCDGVSRDTKGVMVTLVSWRRPNCHVTECHMTLQVSHDTSVTVTFEVSHDAPPEPVMVRCIQLKRTHNRRPMAVQRTAITRYFRRKGTPRTVRAHGVTCAKVTHFRVKCAKVGTSLAVEIN